MVTNPPASADVRDTVCSLGGYLLEVAMATHSSNGLESHGQSIESQELEITEVA